MAKRSKTGKSQPGRLRIVAGKWRSRLLDIADVPGLRPTSERIRETLFNWLSLRLHGARCLDLFAGTGALGLEALSRGAAEAVFVEQSAPAIRALQSNIAMLEADGARVMQADAFAYLESRPTPPFDIVFLDPPFATDSLGELCRLLQQQDLLASDALIYLEQDRSRPGVELPQQWQLLKNKTAGNVRYMLAQRTA
ncbi:MAG: 16S rRNA (guanine(966)-N(2))-methyltransferase RsmD [Gammaproteobacteria bacterium]|nr:16S rRNA (guanine(966)-N(2))-methyltransferase RsmD [Gammaproteobacteria bacterium]